MNKVILTILILTIEFCAFGQEIVQQDNYYDLKQGIYKTQSLGKDLIESKLQIIKPQESYVDKENIAFLKVTDNEIVLFDQINDLGTKKPIGLLTETSIIEVDTIFYNEIYNDPTKDWYLTFNVWYAIKINGRTFYTDYKIHDRIAYQKEINDFNQKFLLISQSTGYDEYYDRGYPNYFFIAVLNQENEMIFNSSILDFDYDDEFWDAELMGTVKTKMNESGFEFTLHGPNESYTATWTGKELKK